MRSFLFGAALIAVAGPAFACADDFKQRLIFESVISGDNYVAPPVPEPIVETTFVREDGTTGYPTDYRGHPAIITLWHPDCPGCRQEMPELNEISAEFKDDPELSFVQVVVNIPKHFGRNVDQAEVRDFLKRGNYDGIETNFDEAGAIFHENCLVATPTHLVLDRSGKVREIMMGPQPWTSDSARNYLQSLISGS